MCLVTAHTPADPSCILNDLLNSVAFGDGRGSIPSRITGVRIVPRLPRRRRRLLLPRQPRPWCNATQRQWVWQWELGSMPNALETRHHVHRQVCAWSHRAGVCNDNQRVWLLRCLRCSYRVWCVDVQADTTQQLPACKPRDGTSCIVTGHGVWVRRTPPSPGTDLWMLLQRPLARGCNGG